MTDQERTILKGMYAAGFRYVVREQSMLLFSSDKFINAPQEMAYRWDIETDAPIDDLGNVVDGLFDWIKADDKEPVEIADIIETEE